MQHVVDFALQFEGLKEIKGPQDNPQIMAMYAELGHSWVEHDEVAWCAAFVGYCLEKCGIKSTRALNARSYEEWGIEVDPKDVQPGDVIVRPRGTKSWQGHVEIVIERVGEKSVKSIGGNVSDSVKVSTTPISRWTSIRRAGRIDESAGMTVRQVQAKLRDLGYFEVGEVDGVMGPRTSAAILAFRADNDMRLVGVIDAPFVTALQNGKRRPVSETRRNSVPRASRIMDASNAGIGLGIIGAGGNLAAAIDDVIAALDQVDQATDAAGRVGTMFGVPEQYLAAGLPILGAVMFAAVIAYAIKARNARIEDHQTGKTM